VINLILAAEANQPVLAHAIALSMPLDSVGSWQLL